MWKIRFCLYLLVIKCVFAWKDDNTTLPSTRHLLDFALEHPKPIGLLTVSAGAAVDVRDTISINSDIFRDDYFFDIQSHVDREKLPERIVHPKGQALWGYFEVTHDVSKYTKADVFNGIGKKTKALVRASVGTPYRGGTDLGRDLKSIAVKLYTIEGNLDFLNLQTPVFVFKDPTEFAPFVHGILNNAKTGLPDLTKIADLFLLRPAALLGVMYIQSDYGVPDGWRHSDYFPVHCYELTNKYGERWYVKFNWRTEQGLKNLTTQQIRQINDPNYFKRDIYNAIENKNYPAWRLEMDVLSIDDIKNVDYNPFEVTRFWKKGTYKTVPIGRLVLNKNSDNQFRDQEQAAFDPSSLVPGIPGPVDNLFRGRRFAYRDTQLYRISPNFKKVGVNAPLYMKTYNRDGHPPVWDNERDAPSYYPNSFNGAVPFVDSQRSKEDLLILETNAVDLQDMADFYNHFLKNEGERQRLAENMALTLSAIIDPVRTDILKIIKLIDRDLIRRVVTALTQILAQAAKASG